MSSSKLVDNRGIVCVATAPKSPGVGGSVEFGLVMGWVCIWVWAWGIRWTAV